MAAAGETPGVETGAAARLFKERLDALRDHQTRGEPCDRRWGPREASGDGTPSSASHPTATDLQQAKAQMHAALHELDLLRQQAERELARRERQLRLESDAAVAALERRFRAKVEALEVRGAPSWQPGTSTGGDTPMPPAGSQEGGPPQGSQAVPGPHRRAGCRAAGQRRRRRQLFGLWASTVTSSINR